jgi:repressor LexA
MQTNLTRRQNDILEYLKMSQRRSGLMPSTREIQHYFGFASQTAAMSHLRASMIDAHICNGDTVILEQREPRKGDIVAALIDGETTLKRYLVEKGQPFLRAENPDYPDLIPVTDLVIQGVLVALLRNAA